MKIIHIEDFFHPDAGYQINILSNYMTEQGHDVTIVTAQLDKIPAYLTSFFGKDNIEERDKAFEQRTGVKVIRVPIYKYLSGRAIYKPSIFRLINRLNPDILYVHGNDTYIGIRYILKLNKIKFPVIFDNHMLDMASTNKLNKLFYWFYRNFITPIIKRHQSIVIRTVEDDYIIRRYHIPAQQAPVIGFGSNLLLFHPDEKVKTELRNTFKISQNSVVFIYAGKLDETKGGLFLARSIEKKFDSPREVIFFIIGNYVGDYGNEVKATLERSENRIIQIPTQKYVDLAKYFQSADYTVFPKQCSLSFYDAQACGLPVLLEENVINNERVQHQNGLTFRPSDMGDLRDKINRLACLETDLYEQMSRNSCEYIKEYFNYADKAEQYMSLINQAIFPKG